MLEGGKIVGLASATEIFSLAAHMLGVWNACCGMTMGPLVIEAGTIARLAGVNEKSGGLCNSLIAIGKDSGPRRIVVRFGASDATAVVRAVEEAGFRIMEKNPDLARRGRGVGTVTTAAWRLARSRLEMATGLPIQADTARRPLRAAFLPDRPDHGTFPRAERQKVFPGLRGAGQPPPHQADQPASTAMVTPCTASESSLARNTAAPVSSSGSRKSRPVGVKLRIC